MYNKMKYAVYAVFAIIVFFVIMDIGTRYSKIADKNETENKNMSVQNTNPPPGSLQQSYNTDKQIIGNGPENEEIAESKGHDELTPEELQQLTEAKRKTYRLDPSQIAEEEQPAPKTEEELYNITFPDPEGVILYEDGKVAEGYKICTSFNIEKDVYTIFSYEDLQSAGDYTQFVNRKYYIYKKVDDKFYRSNYLFDISAPKDSKSSNEISIVKEKYQVVVKGNSNITRRINNYTLKTNYYQYKNLPVLLYLSPAQNSGKTTTESSDIGSKNNNNIENSDLH